MQIIIFLGWPSNRYRFFFGNILDLKTFNVPGPMGNLFGNFEGLVKIGIFQGWPRKSL